MVNTITLYIWDTGALSLFYADHKDATSFMKEIKTGKSEGIVPSIILAEFYYKTWQKFGKQAAQVQAISLRENLLEVKELEENDVFQIGELKVKNPSFSLADCVLVSIAKRTKSEILTTEEPITKISFVESRKFDY